jgi:hypothetical protein
MGNPSYIKTKMTVQTCRQAFRRHGRSRTAVIAASGPKPFGEYRIDRRREDKYTNGGEIDGRKVVERGVASAEP